MFAVHCCQVLNTSGDQDKCYFNFQCAHPLGVLSSFNNFWSNMGYFLLGLLFWILVTARWVGGAGHVMERGGGAGHVMKRGGGVGLLQSSSFSFQENDLFTSQEDG